jgi:DNA-binding SARP family transcriptional activator
MFNYTLLGAVTVRLENRPLAVSPHPQVVLARLLLAEGKPVAVGDLARAVGVQPGAVKNVVYDLRRALDKAAQEEGLPAGKIVIGSAGHYQLPLEREQVDAFRFFDKLDAARDAAETERARLVQEALAEWGPHSYGLFGGQPLTGLAGVWSQKARGQLQTRYRDAVIDSLNWRAEAGDHESVLRECERLAATDPQGCLQDNEFLRLVALAAYLSSQPDRAERLLGRAAGPGQPISAELLGRFNRLRDQTLLTVPRASAAGTAPVHSDSPTSGGKKMGKVIVNFNNTGATINSQTGNVEGNIVIRTGRGWLARNRVKAIDGNAAADSGDAIRESGGSRDG